MNTALVHIWKMSSKNGFHVGHASISLSDGYYISWWPKDAGKKCLLKQVTPCSARSYEQDCEEEEGDPNTIKIPVTSAQEEVMKEYFEKLLQTKLKYNLLHKNCSTVVYEILCAAFPKLANFSSKVRVWFPELVALVANTLSQREISIQEFEASVSTCINQLDPVCKSFALESHPKALGSDPYALGSGPYQA